MGTAKSNRVLHLPGRICKSPTNLALDFPHGGTALGLVRDRRWRRLQATRRKRENSRTARAPLSASGTSVASTTTNARAA